MGSFGKREKLLEKSKTDYIHKETEIDILVILT